MSRVDQYDISVTVSNMPPLGTFDKMSGGEVDSTEQKYHPGAMAEQISLGGTKEVSNVTVSRLYRLDRDLPLASKLEDAVGVESVSVSRQSLDKQGRPYGKPIIYKGTLKKLTLPDPDSESSNAALMELEISTVEMKPTA